MSNPKDELDRLLRSAGRAESHSSPPFLSPRMENAILREWKTALAPRTSPAEESWATGLFYPALALAVLLVILTMSLPAKQQSGLIFWAVSDSAFSTF